MPRRTTTLSLAVLAAMVAACGRDPRRAERALAREVAGCYRVERRDGAGVTRDGYWSEPVRLSTARWAPGPEDTAADRPLMFRLERTTPMVGEWAGRPLLMELWSVAPPDSVRLQRTDGLNGIAFDFRRVGDTLAGKMIAVSDFVDPLDTTRRWAAVAHRVSCTADAP